MCIVSRGLDAPVKFAPTLKVRKGNARYRRGQQQWKGKSAYNPWTHIIHKELIYLLQKFISPRSKVLLRMLLGEGLVGVNHRAIPTFTHKEGNQRTPHASNLSHNGYHTCMLRDLQTSTQVSLQSTTTQQHDSNITIFISQNYCKESNISYSAIYKCMQDVMTNHVNDQFLSSL